MSENCNMPTDGGGDAKSMDITHDIVEQVWKLGRYIIYRGTP